MSSSTYLVLLYKTDYITFVESCQEVFQKKIELFQNFFVKRVDFSELLWYYLEKRR